MKVKIQARAFMACSVPTMSVSKFKCVTSTSVTGSLSNSGRVPTSKPATAMNTVEYNSEHIVLPMDDTVCFNVASPRVHSGNFQPYGSQILLIAQSLH